MHWIADWNSAWLGAPRRASACADAIPWPAQADQRPAAQRG